MGTSEQAVGAVLCTFVLFLPARQHFPASTHYHWYIVPCKREPLVFCKFLVVLVISVILVDPDDPDYQDGPPPSQVVQVK